MNGMNPDHNTAMSRSPAFAVCVFCSASESIDSRYIELAEEVGARIARRGWALVTGGGSISAMGAVARAVRQGGGHTVGVIPEVLAATEVADQDVAELVVTQGMRERKAEMDRRSDAFLALPGGIGTLEELLEVWVARSLGMHARPVVVLDPWNDFSPLRELVTGLTSNGFVSHAASRDVQWTDQVDTAMDALQREPELPGNFAISSPAELLEADVT